MDLLSGAMFDHDWSMGWVKEPLIIAKLVKFVVFRLAGSTVFTILIEIWYGTVYH